MGAKCKKGHIWHLEMVQTPHNGSWASRMGVWCAINVGEGLGVGAVAWGLWRPFYGRRRVFFFFFPFDL